MVRKRREENRASCLVRGERTLTRPPWPRSPAHRLPGLPAPRWSRGGTMSGPGPARRPAPPLHTARTNPSILPHSRPNLSHRTTPRRRAGAVRQASTRPRQRGVTQATRPTALAAKVLEGPDCGRGPGPAPGRSASQATPIAGQTSPSHGWPKAGPAPCPSVKQAPPPNQRQPRPAPDQLAKQCCEIPGKLFPWIANLAAQPGRQEPLQAPWTPSWRL